MPKERDRSRENGHDLDNKRAIHLTTAVATADPVSERHKKNDVDHQRNAQVNEYLRPRYGEEETHNDRDDAAYHHLAFSKRC